jgi:hypothetical protein
MPATFSIQKTARLTAYYALLKKIKFFYAEGIFDDGAGYLSTDAL